MKPLPRGFTLIEVLVSITLLAVVTAVLFSGFYVTTRTWRQGQKRLNAAEESMASANLIRRQIASLYPVIPVLTEEERQDLLSGRGQTPAGPSGGTVPPPPPFASDSSPSGQTTPLQDVLPYFVGEGQRMSFVTLYSLRINTIPGLCLVTYALEPSGTGLALVEYEQRFLGRLPGGALNTVSTDGARFVLMDGLASGTLEYFGMEPSLNEPTPQDQLKKDWWKSWDVRQMRDLPEMVRIRYHMGDKAIARNKEGEILVQIKSQGNNIKGFVNRRVIRAGL